QAAEHLCGHIEQISTFSGSAPEGLFTAWQLSWLLWACDLHLPSAVLQKARALPSALGESSASFRIQKEWMALHGFPSVSGFAPDGNAEIQFYRKLAGLVALPKSNPETADIVFAALQQTAGLGDELRGDLEGILGHGQSEISRNSFRLAESQSDRLWLSAEEAAAYCLQTLQLPDPVGQAYVVALPPPLTTPISWSLRRGQKAHDVAVYLGWPSSIPTALTDAEQFALLAHETCHVRQLLSETRTAGSHTQHLSVFERELQALQCEWHELRQRLTDASESERKKHVRRWNQANRWTQIERFMEDVRAFEAAQNTIEFKNDSLHDPFKRVSLPFSSAVYALSAGKIIEQ
ncbi:MAG: hypothetical protein EBR09_14940, partial [Proteobacteria bacterium]|nr:hypothetical protein [Pseudomonadota bacterium]